MYTFDQIRKGLKQPSHVSSHLLKKYNHRDVKYNTEGTNVFDENWDNLIILDACRYDVFSKQVDFDGDLDYRISRGSASKEFVRGNFQESNQYDVVYCSNNGWYQHLLKETNEVNSEVYRFEFIEGREFRRDSGHARDECQKLSTRALNLYEEHPHKRMIIHYMLPHSPYVDKEGNVILQVNQHAPEEEKKHPNTVFELFHKDSDDENYFTKDELIQAYESSLRFILNHISDLVDELNGLTVISADHGELLGERLYPFPFIGYGHPEGVYMDELVKVPWFECDNKDRREIIEADRPHHSMRETNQISEQIEDHLYNMGYKV